MVVTETSVADGCKGLLELLVLVAVEDGLVALVAKLRTVFGVRLVELAKVLAQLGVLLGKVLDALLELVVGARHDDLACVRSARH